MPQRSASKLLTSEPAQRTPGAHLEAVAALSHLALTSSNPIQLMTAAVGRVAGAFGVEFADLWEATPDGKSLVLRAVRGWPSRVLGKAIDAGPDSLAGFTFLAAEPILLEDLPRENRFKRADLLRSQHVRSGICTIIAGKERPFGVIGAYSRERRSFSDAEVRFLRTVANVLATAVKYYQAAGALHASEARMRAIVTTAVDAIITIDQRGIIDSVNPAAERLFGYAAQELLGKNVSVLMPEPFRAEHDGYINAYLLSGRAKIIGIGREVVGQRKDGSIFPMELAVSEFRLDERRMFAGVVHDITNRRALERRILETADAEQRRIGQDLHDGLCQHLAGIAFAVEVLLQKLSARSAGETERMARVAQMLDEAITHARNLARGLQPVNVETGGLVVALEALAGNTSDVFGISCQLCASGTCVVNDSSAASHLYRIVQEALANAVKHGKARKVRIHLDVSRDQISMVVRDDGIGLGRGAGDGNGMGLRTMAYRANLLGGRLTVQPGKRGGTMVTCIVRRSGIGKELDRIEAGDGKEEASRKDKAKSARRRRSSHRSRASRRAD